MFAALQKVFASEHVATHIACFVEHLYYRATLGLQYPPNLHWCIHSSSNYRDDSITLESFSATKKSYKKYINKCSFTVLGTDLYIYLVQFLITYLQSVQAN